MDPMQLDSDEEPEEPMERLRLRQRKSANIHLRMADDPVINNQIDDWLRESKGKKPFADDKLLADLNLFARQQHENGSE
jgi:hypothetical protein